MKQGRGGGSGLRLKVCEAGGVELKMKSRLRLKVCEARQGRF